MARKTSINTWRNRVYKVLAKLDKNTKYTSSVGYSYRESTLYPNECTEAISITIHKYDGTLDENGNRNGSIAIMEWIGSYYEEKHNKEVFNKIINIVNEAQG